jgi:hypothetical protein
MKKTATVISYLICLSLLMSTRVVLANDCSDQLSSVFNAQDFAVASRDMLIIVRRQAQDFKNVLLRNGTKSVETMRERLKARGEEFEAQLRLMASLSTNTSQHKEVISLIAAEGAKISKTYANSLASLDANDRMTSFKADEIAQGVDVPIFRHLEGLVKQTSYDLKKAQDSALLGCSR